MKKNKTKKNQINKSEKHLLLDKSNNCGMSHRTIIIRRHDQPEGVCKICNQP